MEQIVKWQQPIYCYKKRKTAHALSFDVDVKKQCGHVAITIKTNILDKPRLESWTSNKGYSS